MGIPLVALQGQQQPGLLDQYGKAMQLKALLNANSLAPGQQQIQQQTIQANQQQLSAQQKQADDQAKIAKIFQDSGDDVGSAVKQSMAVNPQLALGYQKQILESQDAGVKYKSSLIDYHSKQTEQLGKILDGISDQKSYTSAIGKALADPDTGLDAATAAKLLSQPYNPQTIAQMRAQTMNTQQFLAQQNEAIKQTETERHNKAEEQKIPVEDAEMKDYLAKNPGKGPVDFAKFKASLAPQAQINIGAGNLTDAALDQAAEKYFATGTLPSMGMGAAGAAARTKIMNRAGELHPEGSLAANSAEYKANQASLSKIQTNFDQVTAFENTAGKNLDQFLTAAKKLSDTGSPLLNKPFREIESTVGGSPDVVAARTAGTTALTEIAKVLNSSNASGVLSDSARNEVEGLIGKGATLAQIQSAADILRKDMANRRDSYQQQIADIQNRLGGKGQVTTTQAPASTGPDPFAQFGGKAHQ